MVRAKFECTSKEEVDGDQKHIQFSAVVDGCEENKSFSRWTPAGNVSMHVSNETQAHDYFEVGKSYYLDFTEAK